MFLPTSLRHGWTEFRFHPWVSLVAVFTLALGVAGATTMFTMLGAIGSIMVPPGVDAARVGRVVWTNPAESGARGPLNAEEYVELAVAGTVFESMAASADDTLVLGGIDGPTVSVRRISRDFFRTLGFRPSAGRAFTSEDWRQGAGRVAMVRESLARRVPGIAVGRVVRLGSDDLTLVGVVPDRCWFPTVGGPDVWLPLETTAGGAPAARTVTVTARVRTEADLDLARSQVEAIGRRLARDPADARVRRLRFVTLQEDADRRTGFGLVGLLGPSLVVLLIACANVANLLLARATRRQREVAVRSALGASRFRLIQERVAESAWLGIAGGIAGIGLASAGVGLLRLWIGSFESARSVADWIRLDTGPVLFAIAVTCLIPIVSGLVPAWMASKPNLTQALHRSPPDRRPRRGPYNGRDLLVIVEIGLAVVLVVTAGMFTRLFAEFDRIGWGFDPAKVLAVKLSIGDGPERRAGGTRLLASIVDEVAHAPGVGVAAAGDLPGPGMPGRLSQQVVEFEGCASATGSRTAQTVAVGPGYFAALGLPVRRGRPITAEDTAGSLPVGVISESHSLACWPGQDPVGRRFRLQQPAAAPWISVVGVVPDTMVTRLQPDGFQHVYVPYAQRGELPGLLLVRSDGDVSALARTVRAAVRRVDATQPLDRVERLDAIPRQVGDRSLMTGLIGGFALFALLLGSLGVFSLMSCLVAERTREFGIRIALGASGRDVVGLVLAHAFVIVGIGSGVSIAGTLMTTRAAFREMADLAVTSAALWAVVCSLLVLVALGASLLPARRATRVEPATALRAD